MHRRALRLNVAGVDVDVPIGVFAAGQFMKYDGTQLLGAAPSGGGGITGPGSTTVGDVVTWNSTTGAVVADSGILASSVAIGPASSVSANLPAFNGTGGKVLFDSGIASSGVVTGPGSAVADNIVSFNGTGGRAIKDSGVSATQLANLACIPSSSQRIFESTLPTIAGALTVTTVAYFVYVGMAVKALTVNRVEVFVTTIGAGAQTAEIGLFSSPSAPNRSASQSLTKLVTTSTVDVLTTAGLRRNTTAFAQAVAVGTHLWAGIHVSMATMQPQLYGLTGDISDGTILSLTGGGSLTGAGPFTGSLITASVTAWQAPMMRVTLD